MERTVSRQRSKRALLPPVQENVEKLEKVVNEGNYYGAQQMYKFTSARYLTSQRFTEALDILQAGACLQLKHGQVTCGSELAVLFVEALGKGKFPYDESILDRVRKIYEMFPQIPVPHNLGDDDDVQQLGEALAAAKTRVDACTTFLKAALKWSAEFGGPKNGAPEIHVMLAEYMYSECPELDMAKVSYHFVRGNSLNKFASTLLNFMGKCYPGEDDLAIARAVLMYLAMGNLRDANNLMDELQWQVESQHHQFPDSELMQFITFLLPMLQRDALPLLNMLRVKYKASIDREPTLNEYLDEVAEKFYGVVRRNPIQGMFGDFFKMMG